MVCLKKDVLFIIGDWNAKVGNRETPGVTGKFGLGVQNEAGQRLMEFFQQNALVIANSLFQQHKRRLLHMDITRWSTLKSDWLYSLWSKIEKLYTVNKKVQNAGLVCSLKNDRMISVPLQGRPFNITIIQDYAPTSNVEEAEVEWFYKNLMTF